MQSNRARGGLLAKAGFSVAVFAGLVLVCEGAYSMWRGGKVHTSLTSKFVAIVRARFLDGSGEDTSLSGAPAWSSAGRYIPDRRAVESLLPNLKAAKVALGNSDFHELHRDDVATTRDDPEVGRVMKPNLHWETCFLRSMLFNAWDPMVYFRNADLPPASPEVERLVTTYGIRRTSFRTDALGFRVTVPEIESDRVVLVVGDSVGFGVLLNDDETIASQLQQCDGSTRYVNACVPGASAEDNLRRLRKLLAHFAGRMRGVVYVHCENDCSEEWPAARIVGQLAEVCSAHGVGERVIVAQQYIYRTMPEVLRLHLDSLIEYEAQHRELLAAAHRHGVAIVDTRTLVEAHQDVCRSPLAGFALYIDQCHFSRLGNEKIAEAIGALR